MKAVAPGHTGLPFVPKPAPNELLGSWLLRLAQLYGLGLATLLCRLGARPPGEPRLPHWFAIGGSDVSSDALAAATRLPQADVAAMAPPSCGSRWPQELGFCASCLVHAADAGQPIAWNRKWMSPLATVCSIHGTWLTPVATRTLASVRHAGDLGGVVRSLKADHGLLNGVPADAGDALWLQDLCSGRADLRPPWGDTRPYELIRIVEAVAREVISGSSPHDNTCGQPGSVKDFAVETARAQRVGLSLPTLLPQRQWALGRAAEVLRFPPEARTFQSSWSAASIKRLASMHIWPDGALIWICPAAAELVRRQDELRKELSISPRYFKACSALLASIS